MNIIQAAFFSRYVSSTLGKMSINTMGIALWNNLSKEIKESVSLNVFKKKIKNEMLNRY